MQGYSAVLEGVEGGENIVAEFWKLWDRVGEQRSLIEEERGIMENRSEVM